MCASARAGEYARAWYAHAQQCALETFESWSGDLRLDVLVEDCCASLSACVCSACVRVCVNTFDPDRLRHTPKDLQTRCYASVCASCVCVRVRVRACVYGSVTRMIMPTCCHAIRQSFSPFPDMQHNSHSLPATAMPISDGHKNSYFPSSVTHHSSRTVEDSRPHCLPP